MIQRPFRPALARLAQHLLWPVVIWVVVFWRLGYLSVLDPDEAHYAQLTREMVDARRWLVPTLEGVPFIDKPVLYHWLQALAEALFGETEFALRLPSALSAIALVWTVRWLGAGLGDARTGRRAALLFACTPLTFGLASVGVFDMLYTALLFGAISVLLVAGTARRPIEWIGWLLLALAVMTKGPVALVLVVITGAALAARSATRPLVTGLRWKLGLAAVILAASPWFVYMAHHFGQRFYRDYLLAGNLYYFTNPDIFSSRHSDVFFYLRTYAGGCFPWSLLAVAAAVDARLTGRRLSLVEQVLWTWIVVVLSFFSIAGFKLDTYIFPAAPATCLIVAWAWRGDAHAVTRPPITAVRLALWFTAATLGVGGAVLALTMYRIDLGLSPLAVLLPLVLIAGGWTLVVSLARRHTDRAPEFLVATLLLIYAVIVVEGFPVLERSRPTAPVGRWIARHAPPDAPVGVLGLDDWRGSLRFYSRRRLAILRSDADVREFVEAHPQAFVVMLGRDYHRLAASGVPVRAVGKRRAIVGRSGRYIRRQLWGEIAVVRPAPAPASSLADAAIDDLPPP